MSLKKWNEFFFIDLEANLDLKIRSPIKWQDHEVERFITIQGGQCYTWCTMLVQTHHILTQVHIAISRNMYWICDNTKYIWNQFVSIKSVDI